MGKLGMHSSKSKLKAIVHWRTRGPAIKFNLLVVVVVVVVMVVVVVVVVVVRSSSSSSSSSK